MENILEDYGHNRNGSRELVNNNMRLYTQLLFEDIKVLKAFAKEANMSLDKVEQYWKEAKTSTEKAHPDLSEDNPMFWKIVTTIVQKRLKI